MQSGVTSRNEPQDLPLTGGHLGALEDVSRNAEAKSRRLEAMEGSPEDKCNFIANIVIPDRQHREGLEILTNLITATGLLDDPGGARIFGESGSGKSVLRKTIQKRYPKSKDGKLIPVLSIEMEQKTTAHAFLVGLVRKLGYPFVGRKTAFELIDILAEALLSYQVKLILFDESQESGEGRGTERPKEIGNVMKRLYDKSHIAQAYLGIPKGLGRYFELGDQLSTRITIEHTMKDFDFGSEFLGVLKSYDDAFPLAERSGLSEVSLAQKVHRATQGNWRRLSKLLSMAVLIAATENSPAVEISHFVRAHVRVFGTGANPFK